MKKHSIRYHVGRMPYYWRLMQVMRSYIYHKRTDVPYPPYRLWIEPTNRCNLKCIMCPNERFSEHDLGLMDFNLYTKLIDEASHFVYDINLHHRGEPTLHPRLSEMIRYAKEKGLSVKLHTNGTTLTDRLSRRLIASGLDLISFSFDGYEAGEYERTRKGARFNRTSENIRRFLSLKAETGGSRPKTVMEIMELIPDRTPVEVRSSFVNDMTRCGLDRLIVKMPHNWGGSVDMKSFQASSYTPCTFPWHALVVLWDGHVGPCPHDFFGKLKLGNVREQSLRDIFNGTPMRLLREAMRSGPESLCSPCRECDSVHRKQKYGIPLESLKYIKE
jgi:radical SAM protein with 4Fe4S-binding SPASM domain